MKSRLHFLLFFLISALSLYSQENSPRIISNSVHEIGVTVDSLAELKSLDWDNLATLFEFNKPKDSITIYVQVKKLNPSGLETQSVSYSDIKISINGISQEKDHLIDILRKRTDRLQAILKQE